MLKNCEDLLYFCIKIQSNYYFSYMMLRKSVPKTTKKRKNYPGAERVVGTKDYALILTNLRGLINQLTALKNEKELGDILKKVSVKLKELGYKHDSDIIKKKASKLEKAKKELPTILQSLNNIWKEGKNKQEEAKKSDKQKGTVHNTMANDEAPTIIEENINDEFF
ncbi:MAG: hypothetical protein OHK0038_09860 [Flammeovirgaceae bacterium]